MADPEVTTETTDPVETTGDPIDTLRSGWKTNWQAPSLLLSLALLGSGVVSAILSAPSIDLEPPIDRAARLVEQESFEEAIDLLNSKVFPYLDKPELRRDQRRRFHELIARSIYYEQRSRGEDIRQNHENVISQLLEAERIGGVLVPRDVQILADTYLSIGRVEKALERVATIPDHERSRRYSIYRRLIENGLAVRSPDYDSVISYIETLLADPEYPQEDRLWALARQAEIQLELGYPDQVITRLLRSLQREMETAPEEQLAELYALLGRAYLETGALDEAQRRLGMAEDLIPGYTSLQGTVQYLLGRVSEARTELEDARDRYAFVQSKFKNSEAYLPAMLGLGEVESVLRNDDDALAAYREVVDLVRDGTVDRNVLPDRISDSLMVRFDDRFEEAAYHVAGRYAALAERVHGLNNAPAPILRAMADVAMQLALEILPETDDIRDIQTLDPASKAEAQRFLVRAGSYYRLHADRTIFENDVYLDSLWRAADAFDRAGGQDEAIELFAKFAQEAQGDERRPEAQYRLGRAYQARLQYDLAATEFESLLASNADRSEGGVGQWGERARVPLAQCLFRDEDPANDERAESLLRAVVEGNSEVGPDRGEYQDALLELGRHAYHTGQYEDAMRFLGEARDRMTEDDRGVQVAYSLADTNRLSAVAIAEELTEAMPDSTRRDLEETRTSRLKSALSLFEEVRRRLEQEDPRRLTELDRVYLRNAMFYMGACAFDLESYEDAIRAYDAARERYSTDPTSLVALVQIVNAHLAMGDFERARTANERAKRFYEGIPDDAWDDPGLPMGRSDWERWLDSTQKLYDLERGQ